MNPFQDLLPKQSGQNPFGDISGQRSNSIKVGGVPLSLGQREQQVAQNLNPVQNFGVGLVKGVGSTVRGLGEMGTKTLNIGTGLLGQAPQAGADIYNPETELGSQVKETLRPSGVGQNIGFFTEKIGEFLAPSSLVTKSQAGITGAVNALPLGTSAVASATKGLLGVAGRAVPEALSAGGVSLVQSGGDVKTAKRDALLAGGSSAVLGGIGSAYRGAMNLAFGPEETRVLVKALKPTGNLAGKGAEKFKRDLPVALELVKKVGEPISDLKSLDKATDLARKSVWAQVEQKVASTGDDTIDGYNLARSIYSTLDDNSKLLLENPEVRRDVLEMASTYADTKLTVPQAQDLLEQTNNFLRSTYRANPSPSEIATLDLVKQMNLKLADALRTSIDDKIASMGGEGAKELRRQYGALSQLSEAVKSRIPKDERLATMSLGQQFNLPVGIGKILSGVATGDVKGALEGGAQIAIGQQLKKMNQADYLINRIFGGEKPGAISSRIFGNYPAITKP